MPGPLKTWPLEFDEGVEVGTIALDGEMIPLPPRKLWFKRAKGVASLMSDGTKEYYLVTLAHNPGTRMQQVGDWLGGDGADKVTKWQLEKIAKQYLPKTMKIAGGLPLAIIGRLLEPSVTATEKFISLQYKEKSVNILLQGF